MTHTPGPWHVAQGSDERDFIVAEAGGNTVCEPNTHCFEFSELDPNVRTIRLDEAKANARLIAAAPDLLEAAKAAFVALPMTKHNEDINAALKAAIAKAEGQELASPRTGGAQ